MHQRKIRFPNAAGQMLAGVLHEPLFTPPRAAVLFAHCFTCTKNNAAAVRISRALADGGYAVLRFDFTGLGESEGDFARSGFSANVADLVAAAAWLRAEQATPALLVGHSLGGLAALQAAARIADCRAVTTIGAPARAEHVARHLDGDLDSLRTRGSGEVKIGGRPFRLSREFLDDLALPPPALAQLRRALLIMHAPRDTIVSIEHASQLFIAAKHPKSFVSLDDADHLLSRAADAAYAAGVIAAWADRYLPAAAPAPSSGVSARTAAQGFRTPIQAGRHRLLADEPATAGGEDAGPSPYDLLSAALAACTSMTLQMYARHKGLALTEVGVQVEHAKIHAEDCEHCATRSGRIDRFERSIRLQGELSDAQRQRLLEIADRCPVHRTLHGEVDVLTRLDT